MRWLPFPTGRVVRWPDGTRVSFAQDYLALGLFATAQILLGLVIPLSILSWIGLLESWRLSWAVWAVGLPLYYLAKRRLQTVANTYHGTRALPFFARERLLFNEVGTKYWIDSRKRLEARAQRAKTKRKSEQLHKRARKYQKRATERFDSFTSLCKQLETHGLSPEQMHNGILCFIIRRIERHHEIKERKLLACAEKALIRGKEKAYAKHTRRAKLERGWVKMHHIEGKVEGTEFLVNASELATD
ncbi:MAG: hypothetical protein KTU85_08800 [Acidimicrobiia bacterium]|nr:hypothetical protein [Acidimicrobiia bacterium]